MTEVEEELKGVGINVAFDLFSKSMKTHLWEYNNNDNKLFLS